MKSSSFSTARINAGWISFGMSCFGNKEQVLSLVLHCCLLRESCDYRVPLNKRETDTTGMNCISVSWTVQKNFKKSSKARIDSSLETGSVGGGVTGWFYNHLNCQQTQRNDVGVQKWNKGRLPEEKLQLTWLVRLKKCRRHFSVAVTMALLPAKPCRTNLIGQ